MAEVLIDTEDSEEIVEFLGMTMHMIFLPKITVTKISPDFHEVEFCPELGISKTNNQSKCHIWQVAHKFWVAF